MAVVKFLVDSSQLSEDYNEFNDYYNYIGEGMKYEPCENTHVMEFGRIFLPTIYTLEGTFGVVGNAILLIILIKYLKFKTTTFLYIVNMLASDFLFSLTLLFWAVYATHSDWIFGTAGCKAVTAIFTINLYSSIFFITCLSLDRYLVIVWAFSTKNLRASSKKYAVCALVWILSFLVAAPSLYFVEVNDFHGQKLCIHNFGEENTSLWRLFMMFQINIFGFLLPFLVMLFFYLRIACVVVKSKVGRKSKTLRLVITLVAAFFVLWFPYNLVMFLHSLQYLNIIYDCTTIKNLNFAIQGTEGQAFFHACLNPILYVFGNKMLRNYLGKMMNKIFKRGREYSLDCSDSTSKTPVQDAGIELAALKK